MTKTKLGRLKWKVVKLRMWVLRFGLKDIINILYLKFRDSLSDLAMCLSWILAESSNVILKVVM